MTLTLVRKLLRDVRLPLLVVCLLLVLFQLLWAKITQRIVGDVAPYFAAVTSGRQDSLKGLVDVIFAGPGKVIQTLLGGENLALDRAMDVLSIGYVHPLMQTLFCIWAVGRATGAVAGEVDRGTIELLLAQPLPRSRLILAHLTVDLLTIPVLCLALWAGNWLGVWLVGPIRVHLDKLPSLPVPLKFPGPDPERLHVNPWAFAPALLSVAALMFAVSGYTMWLSARGRFRWRVLGVAVFVTLVQFLVNLMGQMWEEAAWLRPFTVFYYYQPQPIILAGDWSVTLSVWNGGDPLVHLPAMLVLFAVGAAGYALALRAFCRRDLPAPL
jgi:ABC-2 type transport system permease protein